MQKSEKFEMTPGVFYPQYLSLYWAKIENQEQFWNPQDEQISKLTFLFEFGEDLMEILTKTNLVLFCGHGVLFLKFIMLPRILF